MACFSYRSSFSGDKVICGMEARISVTGSDHVSKFVEIVDKGWMH